MKKLFIILFLLFVGMTWAAVQGEERYRAKTYLNDGVTASGGYTAEHIMPLLKEPLLSVDSNGKKRQVMSFLFTYVERGIFTDDNGKPFIGSDVYSVESSNGRVLDSWIEILESKMKKGDTLKYSAVLNYEDIKNVDSNFYSEPIEIYIK